MGRRILLLVVLLIAGIVLVGVFWPVKKNAPGVTIENFRRLQYGMSEEEVYSILGEPARVVHHPQITEYRWNDSGIEVQVAILNEASPRAGVFRAEVTGSKPESLSRSSTTWRYWLHAAWESAPWW